MNKMKFLTPFKLIFGTVFCMFHSLSYAQEPYVHNIVIPDLWNDWKLVVVTLDKSAKPTDKAEISLSKEVIIKKENGPEIGIQNIPSEPLPGKVLKIQCGTNTVTQKFEKPDQVKGWAAQITCSKQDYYFIINPAHY